MTKAGYIVHVISDCVTSYDLKKLDEMYAYYANKGCEVKELNEYMEGADRPVDDRLAPTETKWRKRVWHLISKRNTKARRVIIRSMVILIKRKSRMSLPR